jgi:hypothetical protein
VSDRLAADDEDVRHTGGGLRLVALTVLAVGVLPMPSIAKQDPKPNQGPSSEAQLPPGQAKKQDPAQQQPATQQAPAPAPAQQQAPAPSKHEAKQQAKAQHKAAKHGTTTTVQSGRQAQTAAPSKQQVKAAQKAAKSSSTATAAPAAQQSQTKNASAPGQVKKAAAAQATAVAPTPAAAPATQPTTTSGSFTAAKTPHKARKHKRAAAKRAAVAGSTAAAVATISPTPLATSTPTKTNATKTGSGSGYVPAPTNTAPHDDSPNVVFRTVRDAVEVIPTTIWVLLSLLTALASLFAVTSARQTRRAHRLAAERGTLLGDVGVLQEAVLPVVPPRVGALALSVAHRPAGGPAAGGDFYDVIALDNDRTALVVGDVTGHGPGALGQATLVRFTLRAHVESGAGPREALAIATESLAPHFEEGFATAAVAIHDPHSGTLTYATAGHEAPIVVGPGDHEPLLVASSPPLGVGTGPSARRQTTVPFPEQSLACMLTDGALEARVRGELVGRARVEDWVRELGERPAAGDMAEMVRSRAAVSDDLAVCFATSTAGEDTGDWRVEELHRPTPDEAERFLEACGASDEHKRSAAEALRFTREGTLLSVRFENDAVVSAEVLRTNSQKPVAA